VICPWCYIGKRRLDRALAMSASDQGGSGLPHLLAVRWHPFLLNPGMATGGMDRKAYLAWKFGGIERVGFISERIAQEGRQDGIAFAFERITRTPNSTDAHRAILFAQGHGDPDVLVEALFAAYFTEGRDIGARDELIEIGAACGLDADRLRDYLRSDAGHAEVIENNERARALGINAVPCFVFDGRGALAGAQPPEVFLRLFDFARRTQDIAVS
jgi:predicted DsbA family dithiol-disulfide isomerase